MLNAMVASSPAMMRELRKHRVLLQALGVELQALWIPSAVNRFTDRLSRTWDPGDCRDTEALIDSIQSQYQLDEITFRYRPLHEPPQARSKYLCDEMHHYLGDGRSRLFAPPFEMLLLVLLKIESEGAKGVIQFPNWLAQAWFERLSRCSSRIIHLGNVGEHSGNVEANYPHRISPSWNMSLAILQ